MSVDLSILEEYARQRRREIASDPRDIRCSVSLEELEGLLALAADGQIAGAGLEQAIKDLAGLREAIQMIGAHLVGCSERRTKKYVELDRAIREGKELPPEAKALSPEDVTRYRDSLGTQVHTTNNILGTIRTIARVKANVDF